MPEAMLPRKELVQAVRDCWVTPKPRVPNLEEVAKLLGPRESADFYSAETDKGAGAENRATRVIADFARYLMACALGTAEELPKKVGDSVVTLSTDPAIDGSTGLADAARVN